MKHARSRRTIVTPSCIAPQPGGDQNAEAFQELVATARRLQSSGGCPWDRAQTIPSLLPHLIEEAWEVFCATRSGPRSHLKEELGDVLYTVVFLALIAERRGWFTLSSLLTQTRQKMIRRHPHVFGTHQARTAQDAYRHWQRMKRRESADGSSRVSSQQAKRHFRALLVEVWEAFHRHPETRHVIRYVLAKQATGRRPSTRSARSGRS